MIASAGFGYYVVSADPNALTLTLAAIVSACILLGMEQIILGYEIQRVHRVSFRVPHAASSKTSVKPLASTDASAIRYTSSVPDLKIPRPENFPPGRHEARILASSPDSVETGIPASASGPVEEQSEEERLENLKQNLLRLGRSNESTAPDSARTPRVKGRREKRATKQAGGDGADGTSFHVSLVGKDEIVLSRMSTGEEVKFPCVNSEALETAWRAFAKGDIVRPELSNGRITRLSIS